MLVGGESKRSRKLLIFLCITVTSDLVLVSSPYYIQSSMDQAERALRDL
jgi:hypothetical protein